MKQYGFYIDTVNCSGCKTCQVACQDKNNLEPDLLWRKIIDIEGGKWQDVEGVYIEYPFAYHVSMSCNHCIEPLCVNSCPTQAMYITDIGTVDIDQDKCIGCGYCTWACPYDSPRLDHQSGRMSKCDLCYDKIKNNQNPSCVDACPMRALEFGDIGLLRQKYGVNRSIFPLASPDHTHPSIIIRPHKDSHKATSSNSIIANMEEL